MNVEQIDHDMIVTIAISVSSVLIAVISTLIFWLRKTLIILFEQTLENLEKDIVNCQEKLHIRIDQIDRYGQANRKVSYQAKDGIADHVKEFHSKKD